MFPTQEGRVIEVVTGVVTGVEGEEEEEEWITRGEEGACRTGGMRMKKWKKMTRIEG